jgi:uncharacterized protein
VTPLWAAVNTQWQPRTRYPQLQEMEQQKATYLDVMIALLDAGTNVDARIRTHPWYLVYSGCGNRNCGLADTAGSTAFWRAAYATDLAVMKLLVAHGADPNIPTIAPPQPVRRGPQGGGPGQDTTNSPAAPAKPSWPIIASGGPVRTRFMPPRGSSTAKASPETPIVMRLTGGCRSSSTWSKNSTPTVNASDNDGYTPLHYASARGDNDMIQYLVSKGADVTAVARSGQSTADMANGPVQRISPFPATVALLEKLGSKNNHKCVSY